MSGSVRESNASEGDSGITIAQFVDEIRRRWIVPACIVAFCVLASLALCFALPEVYRAEAIVRQADVGQAGLLRGSLGNLAGLASMAGVDLGSAEANKDALPTLNSGALVGAFISGRGLQSVLVDGDEGRMSLWHAVRKFRRNVLAVSEDRRASLITVSVRWKDPEQAADWANGIVELTNETLRKRDSEDAARSLAFLNSQLARTEVVDMRRVLFELMEAETRKLMLADARKEYALVVIDKAVPPELRASPRRTLIMLAGGTLGGILALLYILGRIAISQQE